LLLVQYYQILRDWLLAGTATASAVFLFALVLNSQVREDHFPELLSLFLGLLISLGSESKSIEELALHIGLFSLFLNFQLGHLDLSLFDSDSVLFFLEVAGVPPDG
jgi:hypothetical protein